MATQFNLYKAEMDTEPTRSGPAPSRSRGALDRLPRWSLGPVKPIRCQWYLPVKGVVDRLAALVLLLFASPVILLFALLVKITSRGPAFYTQTRLGLYGRHFTIYKLRTMIDNCESLTGPRWSMPGDPRVTRLGAFLRATHLDELPQLLNVLKGDMSLIGPRPERPEFLQELERQLPGYRQRLTVRPGVTGLAQVQLPPDSDLTSVRRKLAYDLYYIRKMTPWAELVLLVATGFYALGMPYASLRRLLRFPDCDTIERAMQAYVFDGNTPPAQPRRAA